MHIFIGSLIWLSGFIFYLIKQNSLFNLISIVGLIIIYQKGIWYEALKSNDDKDDNVKYNFIIFFILFSIGICLVSLIFDLHVLLNLKTPIDKIDNLFARSGAVLVLFGVICEFNLNKISIAKSPNDGISIIDDKGESLNAMFAKNIPSKHTRLTITSHLIVVIGTLIWGYGDLIIKIFFNIN